MYGEELHNVSTEQCTLVQALRLCTGLDGPEWALEGVKGQPQAPAALYPRERTGARCT